MSNSKNDYQLSLRLLKASPNTVWATQETRYGGNKSVSLVLKQTSTSSFRCPGMMANSPVLQLNSRPRKANYTERYS